MVVVVGEGGQGAHVYREHCCVKKPPILAVHKLVVSSQSWWQSVSPRGSTSC